MKKMLIPKIGDLVKVLNPLEGEFSLSLCVGVNEEENYFNGIILYDLDTYEGHEPYKIGEVELFDLDRINKIT